MPFKDPQRKKEYNQRYQKSWHQRNKERRLTRIYQQKVDTYWYIQDLKAGLRCAYCGFNHPAALQFHHRNKEDKLFNIGEAVYRKINLEKVKQEIAKCIVICANCHFIHHWKDSRAGRRASETTTLAGQLFQAERLLQFTPEEEAAYQNIFGHSEDPEEMQRHYLEFYGVDTGRKITF